MERHDVVIVGAGIVGMATAHALQTRLPGIEVAVLEKEDAPGRHQTGHNSGVVHSGLYYRPGSLKARLCVDGRRRLLEFCDAQGIPVGRHGKVVVATTPDQLPALDELWDRGHANGLSGLERLGPDGIRDVEPHADGIAGIRVPETAVVDYSAVTEKLVSMLSGELVTGAQVDGIEVRDGGVRVRAADRSFDARALVNCAGLHTDRVAALAGVQTGLRIVPFRGEYYRLTAGASGLVNGMIYPVPDPRFPFLGVHFTRRIDDSVEVGPNAVLALAREHYRGARPSPGDLWDTLSFPGFWKLARRHWRQGAEEMWHSLRAASYARLARSLVPELAPGDLEPGGAGVRAQAVDRQGRLLDDFEIVEAGTAVHVLNAPSPAATSSFAIGDHVAGLVARHLG